MNIIKGLDRISFIVAVIAILPAFFFGTGYYYYEIESINPAYTKWWEKRNEVEQAAKKQYAQHKDRIDRELDKPKTKAKSGLDLLFTNEVIHISRQVKKYVERTGGAPRKFKHPPVWQSLLVGFVTAGVTFVVVLFGLRFTTRGIKRLSIWVFEGFKE